MKETHKYSPTFHSGNQDITCYVDFDFVSEVADRRSVSRFLVKLEDAVCEWSPKKQTKVALSPFEAECHAMKLATRESVRTSQILKKSENSPQVKVLVKFDHPSAISLANLHPNSSARAKHIEAAV